MRTVVVSEIALDVDTLVFIMLLYLRGFAKGSKKSSINKNTTLNEILSSKSNQDGLSSTTLWKSSVLWTVRHNYQVRLGKAWPSDNWLSMSCQDLATVLLTPAQSNTKKAKASSTTLPLPPAALVSP